MKWTSVVTISGIHVRAKRQQSFNDGCTRPESNCIMKWAIHGAITRIHVCPRKKQDVLDGRLVVVFGCQMQRGLLEVSGCTQVRPRMK